jgi:urease accessory protein
MFAVTSPSKPPAPAPRPAPVHQRSIGALDLVISRDAQGSRPMRIYENGCMKARFPKAPGRDPHAVLVNLAGGLTGGDVIDMAVTLGPGASATVTSQA